MILYIIFTILAGVMLWEWEDDRVVQGISIVILLCFFCYSILIGYYHMSCSIECDNHLKWRAELEEQIADPESAEKLEEYIIDYNKRIDIEKANNKDILAKGIFHSNKWNDIEYLTIEGE